MEQEGRGQVGHSATVLVTGATGFIGRVVCHRLLADGYRVRACVRTPAFPELDNRIETVTVTDIGENRDWRPLVEEADYVIHLAGLAHQIGVQGKTRQDEFLQLNVETTRRLAKAASTSSRLQRFLFLSSIAVVGSTAKLISEETPCCPDTYYGRSKLLAERAVEEEFRLSSSDWCVLRPALVYGPGNPGNMARLVGLIRSGLPLPLGGICNRRNFLYVENLVDVILICLLHPKASCRMFIVADQESLSTPQLVQELAAASGRSARIFWFPPRLLQVVGSIGDVVGRLTGRSVGFDAYSARGLSETLIVDCAELRRAVDWQPRFTIRQGLARTAASWESEKTE